MGIFLAFVIILAIKTDMAILAILAIKINRAIKTNIYLSEIKLGIKCKKLILR